MCCVSVIVPVYNVEKYLEKCLKSIVNQTLEDIEIIIVNDGSEDNSQEIIDMYVEKYCGKVVSFKKENGGLSDARNYGLQHAKGEYIGFVDSDDWIEMDMYENLYKYGRNNGAEIVISDFILEPENIVNFANLKKQTKLNIKNNPELLLIEPSVCNKLFKRSLFLDNNITFPTGLLHEDRFTIAKLFYYSKSSHYIGKGYYHYLKQRENSITTAINIKKFTDIMIVLNKVEDFFKQNHFNERIKSTLEILLIDLYIAFSVRAIKEIKDIEKRNSYLGDFRNFIIKRVNYKSYINNSKNIGIKKTFILYLLLNRYYLFLNVLINIKR